jgi:hypothetical protein
MPIRLKRPTRDHVHGELSFSSQVVESFDKVRVLIGVWLGQTYDVVYEDSIKPITPTLFARSLPWSYPRVLVQFILQVRLSDVPRVQVPEARCWMALATASADTPAGTHRGAHER